MVRHQHCSAPLIRSQIRSGAIALAGNRALKIFGLLSCRSGKRMAKSKRVFFAGAAEAKEQGYRPCGHCLRNQYHEWKSQGQKEKVV